MKTRRELTVVIAERYQVADREVKKAILDEFVKVTGYHRTLMTWAGGRRESRIRPQSMETSFRSMTMRRALSTPRLPMMSSIGRRGLPGPT